MVEEDPKFNVTESYKHLVLTASENSSDIIIENSTLEHARFLTYHLIKNANKNIRIFTGSLHEIFFQDSRIKKAIGDAVKRGVNFDIIAEKKLTKLDLPDKKYESNISYKILEQKPEMKNHFLVSDDVGFRFEGEHGELTIPYHLKGNVSFHSPDICNTLVKLFDKIKSTG